jgi:RHS repeat-associated protein
MANMLLSPANAAAGKGFTGTNLVTINAGQIPGSFFTGANGEITTIPKAYINYIFFDDQFKYAGGNVSRVGASGTVKDHWTVDAQLQNITVPKNGYIFVYVSNESNLDVFFDNLQVIHKPGPILEETHYYPFGLTMAGISSRAAGKLENKIKFQKQELQHKEFSDGSGLEMYGFKYRMDDPQTGRFWQIDPLADKYVYNSTYAFSENKVTAHVELEGLESVPFMTGNPIFDGIANTILGWGDNFRNGRDNLVAGANREASSQSGQSGNLPKPVQDMQSIQGKLEMNAGVLEMNKPALDIIVNTGLSVVAVDAPGVAPLIQGTPFRALQVSEQSISSALEGSTMKTVQSKVSLPMVQDYVKLLEQGKVAPGIKVAEGVIVDGNHRYVAGKVLGKVPATTPGTLPPSQIPLIQPVKNLKIDPFDWRF